MDQTDALKKAAIDRFLADNETMCKLFTDIIYCPNVRECLDSPDSKHPCASIVKKQGTNHLNEHQLPEPWNGDLMKAPILFLSSNPSIDRREKYPTSSWKKEVICDFFENRFVNGKQIWVENFLYPLYKNGNYREQWVRFWAFVRGRARELLDRKDVLPGVDYAITEIVHCKTKEEYGVENALCECTCRYLDKILYLSGAKVVVCLGKIVENVIRLKYDRECMKPNNIHIYKNAQMDKWFAFLPHSNFRGSRTFSKCFSTEEIEELKNVLQ